jgi:type VII secretion-associated serine protease mycosin
VVVLTRYQAAVVGAAACALAVAVLSGGSAAADTLTAHPEAAAQSVPQQARSLEMGPLEQVGATEAWQVSKGAGVTVGVLDTGAVGTVPDLTGSVTTGQDYTIGADPAGYSPPHLHGTYIASLIAGHGSGPGDSEGIIGVAPDAKVLSVRVILDDGEPGLAIFGSSSKYANSVADGITYAVNHGVRVINMSLGGNDPNRSLRNAVEYAVSHGVVVVASAGNSGTSGRGYTAYDYPASFTGVISVAAVDSNGRRASFSDKNASVVLSAPGVNVVGAVPADQGQYIEGSGTSPAAAFVTGVAALILSKYPHLSPALVEQALVTSATHRPAGGYSPSVGHGEVNAPGALAAAAQLARTPAATGLAPTAHFGAGQLGAIQVTHRDETRIKGYAAASGVALLGFLIALVLLVIASRRAIRNRRQVAMAGIPGWPVPGTGWPPAGGQQPAHAATMPPPPAAMPPPLSAAPPPPATVPPPPAQSQQAVPPPPPPAAAYPPMFGGPPPGP